MDIASVYLNLASLLGTEIEVEGYYEWGPLYAYTGERQGLSIFLPRYIVDEVLPMHDGNIFPYPEARIFLKGVLKQNRRGDPMLDEITLISCFTDEGTYRATLTRKERIITCELYAELALKRGTQLSHHMFLEKPTHVSKVISKPIILEGYLEGPKRGFSLRAKNIMGGILNDWLLQAVWGTYDKSVFISYSSKETEYFEKRFGTRLGGRGPRLGGAIFTIYGQIESLSVDDRKKHAIKRSYKLKFTSIDHITIRKTITFGRPQDE